MPGDLERTNLHIPTAYKQAVRDAGEDLAGFVREAMRREFKRRKIQVEKLPEIKPGRPRANNPADAQAEG